MLTREFVTPVCADDQERKAVQRCRPLGQHREGCGIGPLQVVEEDDGGTRLSQPLERPPDGPGDLPATAVGTARPSSGITRVRLGASRTRFSASSPGEECRWFRSAALRGP